MNLNLPKKLAVSLMLGLGVFAFSACTTAQTLEDACGIIDGISQEAEKQARDEAQQRKHLETSLQRITNPQVKEYTDKILSELQEAKRQLSDLTTTRRDSEETTAEARQQILSRTSSAITTIKTRHIDALCKH